MSAASHRAVIALGANLGDALGALQGAVDQLNADARSTVVKVSAVYDTAPIGGPDQPDYRNLVLLIDTDRSAHELLELAHAIENQHGRVRDVRWGPRTLDVDVIAYDDVVDADPELTLPHPRAHERAFVLWPWFAVDPDAQLNERGPIRDLLPSVADQRIQRTDLALPIR